MAYSAINRIIHKLFINVNPIICFFGDIFSCILGGFLLRFYRENWV